MSYEGDMNSEVKMLLLGVFERCLKFGALLIESCFHVWVKSISDVVRVHSPVWRFFLDALCFLTQPVDFVTIL